MIFYMFFCIFLFFPFKGPPRSLQVDIKFEVLEACQIDRFHVLVHGLKSTRYELDDNFVLQKSEGKSVQELSNSMMRRSCAKVDIIINSNGVLQTI